MRIAILGNSGSGKSTLAHWLASQSKNTPAALLDLDTVAWEPGQIAVPRSPAAAAAAVRTFCQPQTDWVLEGCYADLIQVSLDYQPWLLFLNPGLEACLAHCRARPWEPHKYSSPEEQQSRLAFLLDWVSTYESREGELSLQGHRACFESYSGPKQELKAVPELDSSFFRTLQALVTDTNQV